MANSSNNPNIARQAYDTSQFAVNRANNAATGRLPNTYTPYDSNDNPYGYFNSSRQEGKTPSPDAPRVEDVSPSSDYCNRDVTISRPKTEIQQNIQNSLCNMQSKEYPSISDLVYKKVDEIKETLTKQKELHKNNTGSLFIGVSSAAGAAAEGSFYLGIGIDNDGNIGIISTGAIGGGFPLLSLNGFISLSNAGELQSLAGSSFTIGVSGGELVVGESWNVRG